jgi:hypothetical protein
MFYHRWLPKNLEAYREMEKLVLEKHDGRGLLSMELQYPNWKLRLGGHNHPVESLKIDIGILHQQGDATHRTYERHSTKGDTKLLHHFKGTVGGSTFETVFTQGPPLVVKHTGNRPPGPLTPEELTKALQSAFPDGFTFKINDQTIRVPVDSPIVKHKRRGDLTSNRCYS